MRYKITLAALVIGAIPSIGFAADEVSVERGRLVSIISGCHDCHTDGYGESEGNIDPAKAMKGRSVGWRGPWVTTYARNLRRHAQRLTEDGYVLDLTTIRALPPMPLVQCSFDARERYEVAIQVSKISRRSGGRDPLDGAARGRPQNTVHRPRPAANAEALHA
jgi:hypothetical protein